MERISPTNLIVIYYIFEWNRAHPDPGPQFTPIPHRFPETPPQLPHNPKMQKSKNPGTQQTRIHKYGHLQIQTAQHPAIKHLEAQNLGNPKPKNNKTLEIAKTEIPNARDPQHRLSTLHTCLQACNYASSWGRQAFAIKKPLGCNICGILQI